jgi:hypothetical protein
MKMDEAVAVLKVGYNDVELVKWGKYDESEVEEALSFFLSLAKRVDVEKFIELIGNCYTAREKAQAIFDYLTGKGE